MPYSKKIFNLTTRNGTRALAVALGNHERNRHAHDLVVVTLSCLSCNLKVGIFSNPDQKYPDVCQYPFDVIHHINLSVAQKVDKVLSFAEKHRCLIIALVEYIN